MIYSTSCNEGVRSVFSEQVGLVFCGPRGRSRNGCLKCMCFLNDYGACIPFLVVGYQ